MKFIILTMILFSSCGVKSTSQLPINGSQGTQGEQGIAGLDGTDGTNGQTGEKGQDGKSCTVTQNSLGALIQCPDGTSAVVLHGQNSKCKEKKHNCNKKD